MRLRSLQVQLRRKVGPGFRQWRADCQGRKHTINWILAHITTPAPEHSHKEAELIFFPRARLISIRGQPHRTVWVFTFPRQPHTVLEPGWLVAIKFGPKST